MTALAPFPTRVEELDASWLTSRLQAGGVTGDEVVSCSSSVIGEGSGMMSNVFRVVLTYREQHHTGPDAVVAKFTTTNPANRLLGQQSAVYMREVSFYRTVAPQGLVPVPACYAAEYNPDTGESLLLLEDMDGYEDGDQVVGCTAARAAAIIDAVVPLHIRYWGQTDDPALSWLWKIDGDNQIAAIGGAVQVAWAPCVEKFGYAMTPELTAAGDRYVGGMSGVNRQLAELPQTVVHGDLRLDNIMYGRDPAHRPIVAIDWQGVLASNAVMDLSYLLSQNVTQEERRAHDRELVAHYHRRLTEGGITGFSLDDCWEAYRLGALYTLAYAIYSCGGVDSSNERGRRQQEAMIRRASQAVTDLGALSLLP